MENVSHRTRRGITPILVGALIVGSSAALFSQSSGGANATLVCPKIDKTQTRNTAKQTAQQRSQQNSLQFAVSYRDGATIPSDM